MLKFKLKLLGGALATIFLLLFFSGVAGATIIPPGSCINKSGSGGCATWTTPSTPNETGTLVAQAEATYDTSIAAGDLPHTDAYGYVTEGVYREMGGTLDFVYQFVNQDSTDGATSFNVSNYSLVVPNVNYFNSPPTHNGTCPVAICGGSALFGFASNMINDQPTQVNSSGTGRTLAWSGFDGSGEHNTSSVLIIRTNATTYTRGLVSIIATGTQTLTTAQGNAFGTFLSPSSVPEPGFYGVLAIGLGGLFAAVKRRRNKQSA